MVMCHEARMTPTDAAAIALLGSSQRRLLAALLRSIRDRATEDDRALLPARADGETLLTWACRCAAAASGDVSRDATGLAREAANQLDAARRIGAAAISLPEARYPVLLAAIPDPPPLLWIKGQARVLTAPAIAIVGSRAPTPYALGLARQLSSDLAAAGAVIVSGLARGVDSAAHGGALNVKGRTIGVLGCGIDRIYPAEHRDLARDMEHAGAIVSEFPVGVPPLPHHFPLRNRIIAGLSTAVVVVEAAEKSGSLITASAAIEQGREVMVVPGPTTGGRNRGGHLLIRDGAKIVESADDILRDLNFGGRSGLPIRMTAPLGRLPETPDFTIDDVAEETGEPPNVVLARLLELELTGQIQRIGGGRFIRVLT
jgi:DNA processing protein